MRTLALGAIVSPRFWMMVSTELVEGLVDLDLLLRLQPIELPMDCLRHAHFVRERWLEPLGEQFTAVTIPGYVAKHARRDLIVELHEEQARRAVGGDGLHLVADGKPAKDHRVLAHLLELGEAHREPRDLHQLRRMLEEEDAPIRRDHRQRLEVAVQRLEAAREVEDNEPASRAVLLHELVELTRQVGECFSKRGEIVGAQTARTHE
jgi:hypothetical protein